MNILLNTMSSQVLKISEQCGMVKITKTQYPHFFDHMRKRFKKLSHFFELEI
jgi:hypothetical protein